MITPSLRIATCGAVLSTVWMFPLLNALATLPAWLHWTWFDSLETLFAWLAGSGAVALTLWAAARRGNWRLHDAVCLVWLAAGGLFVAGAVCKISYVKSLVEAYRADSWWVASIGVVVFAAAAALLVARPGRNDASRVQRGVTMMWPLVLLLLFHLARAPGFAESQMAALSPHPPQHASAAAPPQVVQSPGSRPRTVVLLFDELSAAYLHGAHAVDRSRLPALRTMLEDGDLHENAYLPGGSTAFAIPALFGATDAAPQGLVHTLAAQGRSVRVWGWYHDYCHSIAIEAAVCHSNSIYNPRTLHSGLSLIDPWWTNFNLLPAERPFDLLKTPTAVALHRATLARTRAWLVEQLADPRADVIFAHVNVPHLPLLGIPAEGGGSERPFVMTEKGYVAQFAAVDDIVSVALSSQTRATQLIVISDHEARSLTPQAQHEHVVFLVRRSWAPGSRIHSAREHAASMAARLILFPEAP